MGGGECASALTILGTSNLGEFTRVCLPGPGFLGRMSGLHVGDSISFLRGLDPGDSIRSPTPWIERNRYKNWQ